MTFLQLQNVNLEQSESMNSERLTESSRSSSFNILDQIKRSAGNTPAKKRLTQQEFADTVQNSNTDIGFAGFATNLTASTSQSSSSENAHIQTDFPLFQTSSSRTAGKDDSRQEEDLQLDFRHDGRRDKSDNHWATLSCQAANFNINEQHDSKNRQQQHRQHQQLHTTGPVERTFQVLDTRRSESASAEKTNKSSPLHSVGSRSSSSDTSWDEDGDVMSASLLDNTDGEEEDHGMMEEANDEGLYDDDYDDDGSSGEDDESYSDGMGNPLNVVESFLDELSEVDGVQQLGTLLYQVGSCTFSGGFSNMLTADDDDYTVSSDTMPETTTNGSGGARTQRRGRSTSPRPMLLPAFSNGTNLFHNTADSVSHIIQSLSLQADSILEIVSSHSSSNNSNDDGEVTPNYSKRSFFESMFSCNG
jgi:hypothetical protein